MGISAKYLNGTNATQSEVLNLAGFNLNSATQVNVSSNLHYITWEQIYLRFYIYGHSWYQVKSKYYYGRYIKYWIYALITLTRGRTWRINLWRHRMSSCQWSRVWLFVALRRATILWKNYQKTSFKKVSRPFCYSTYDIRSLSAFVSTNKLVACVVLRPQFTAKRNHSGIGANYFRQMLL